MTLPTDYVDGDVLSASDVNAITTAVGNLQAAITKSELNEQIGTSYNIVDSDAGKIVLLTAGPAVTVNIPNNDTVPFPNGTRVDLINFGTGVVTIGGFGVTIVSKGSARDLSSQYSAATCIKISANFWVLVGDLT